MKLKNRQSVWLTLLSKNIISRLRKKRSANSLMSQKGNNFLNSLSREKEKGSKNKSLRGQKQTAV